MHRDTLHNIVDECCLRRRTRAERRATDLFAPVEFQANLPLAWVVEDEEDVREMVRESLEECGYTVLEARDLKGAVEIAQGHGGPIHLLMTDVVLPGASGGEVARRLVLLRPGLKVLYTSGYTDDAIVRYGVQDLDVAFLQKPYGLTALGRKIREVLDESERTIIPAPGTADPYLVR